MGASDKVRLLLEPLVSATYLIPKLAIFPLLMDIFGIGEVSKIVAIALGCFFRPHQQHGRGKKHQQDLFRRGEKLQGFKKGSCSQK
jgi:hypothetical protein